MRERLLAAEKVTGIQWRNGTLHLLDQRLLPVREHWLACTDVTAVVDAIRQMAVRGAPAIGISAAYGLVLALRQRLAEGEDWEHALEEDFLALPKPGLRRPTCSGRSTACASVCSVCVRMKTCWRSWRPKRWQSMKATAKPT